MNERQVSGTGFQPSNVRNVGGTCPDFAKDRRDGRRPDPVVHIHVDERLVLREVVARADRSRRSVTRHTTAIQQMDANNFTLQSNWHYIDL